MKTPTKITLEEFLRRSQAYLLDDCMPERYICTKCSRQIETVTASVSIHDSPFPHQCVGTGNVVKMPIPYCPNCEACPALSGCLHPQPVQTCAK